MTERILPAYPLWLVDPLFSVWSKTDTLNAGDTVFWTGLEKRAFGFVRWNGKTYSFLGRRDRAIPLTQTKTDFEREALAAEGVVGGILKCSPAPYATPTTR